MSKRENVVKENEAVVPPISPMTEKLRNIHRKSVEELIEDQRQKNPEQVKKVEREIAKHEKKASQPKKEVVKEITAEQFLAELGNAMKVDIHFDGYEQVVRAGVPLRTLAWVTDTKYGTAVSLMPTFTDSHKQETTRVTNKQEMRNCISMLCEKIKSFKPKPRNTVTRTKQVKAEVSA